MTSINEKVCPGCKESKPYSSFYANRTSKINCSAYCKVCANVMSKEYAKKNADKIQPKLAGYALKRRYGITVADYEAQLSKQLNRCAICAVEACPTGRKFAVDHDHTTGAVRGLLCAGCNQGLGNFRDSLIILENAINYLENYK